MFGPFDQLCRNGGLPPAQLRRRCACRLRRLRHQATSSDSPATVPPGNNRNHADRPARRRRRLGCAGRRLPGGPPLRLQPRDSEIMLVAGIRRLLRRDPAEPGPGPPGHRGRIPWRRRARAPGPGGETPARSVGWESAAAGATVHPHADRAAAHRAGPLRTGPGRCGKDRAPPVIRARRRRDSSNRRRPAGTGSGPQVRPRRTCRRRRRRRQRWLWRGGGGRRCGGRRARASGRRPGRRGGTAGTRDDGVTGRARVGLGWDSDGTRALQADGAGARAGLRRHVGERG